jgi:hypothetical protein
MAREGIAISVRERWWTATDVGAGAHRVHEVPHHQDAADRIRRVTLSARIERFATLGDYFCGKRNVCSNDQIASAYALYDLVVSDIEAECVNDFGTPGVMSLESKRV